MAMPRRLVGVRHAKSEANIVQKLRKQHPNAPAPERFADTHDAHMRLATVGLAQSAITGAWLRQEFPDGFDRYDVSSLVRTRETAGALGINGAWRIDDRWRERDWGEYSGLTEEEQEELYKRSAKLKRQHPWYWGAPGGESLATGVHSRIRDILTTYHREAAGKRVIAVSHGETLDVLRVVVERRGPDEWLAEREDESRKISNAMAIDYSTEEPETGEVADYVGWMRAVCPWNPERSWNNGEWMTIPKRPKYTDDQLLADVERYPRLFLPTDEEVWSTYSD